MTTNDDQTPKDTTEADSSAGVSCAEPAGSAVCRPKESGSKTAREIAAEVLSGICPPTWLVMCAERIKSHEAWPDEPHPEDLAKTHEVLDLLNDQVDLPPKESGDSTSDVTGG